MDAKSCMVDYPPFWVPPSSPTLAPIVPAHTHYHFTPAPVVIAAPARLSDEDVERIAKRVAELIKESK